MKLSISLLFVLFSFSLYANQELSLSCPKMEGIYECKAGSRVSLKEIVATKEGFIINSDGSEREYFIDDQFREIIATDSYKDAFYKSRCHNESFIVDFKATLLYEGAEVAKQSQTSTYSMNGEDLVIVQKTKAKGLPLPTIKYICKR